MPTEAETLLARANCLFCELTPGAVPYGILEGLSGISVGPPAPDAPVATAATNVLDTSFDANWNAVAGATSYRLDVSTSNLFGSFVGIYNDLNVGNVTTFSVTGLAGGTTYFYRVRTVNAGGASVNSNTISQITVPAAPVATAGTNLTNTTFDANWNASTGAASYRLDVATDAGFVSFVSGFNNLNVGNVATFTVTGLAPSGTYFYRVRAVDAAGTSASSNTITVTMNAANLLVGLIHAYMFNEGAGATVPDRVGGKDLTIQGGAAWVTQAGQPAIQLNGTNQWLDTAAWAVGANNVSMIGWFYYTAAMATFQSMFIEKEAVNAQWELLSNLGFSLRGGAGAPTAGGTSPAPNAWHQLGGTIAGTVGKVYGDGVDVTTTSPVAAFTDASTALEIGRFNSGFFFAGFVGPVYIYNRAITAAEMLQLFNVKYLF